MSKDFGIRSGVHNERPHRSEIKMDNLMPDIKSILHFDYDGSFQLLLVFLCVVFSGGYDGVCVSYSDKLFFLLAYLGIGSDEMTRHWAPLDLIPRSL